MPLSPQITITPEDIVYKSFDITAVSYTSSTATYTATGHTLSVGNIVTITGLAPDGYNGTFTITATATNTFTVANTTNTALTDQSGNVYWADGNDYDLSGGQSVTFVTNNLDLANSLYNPAISDASKALADAATALTNAQTAYNAAVGSLQPSANTIVNASNQMTAINAGGITVYSGASSSTGARVVMNSAGIAAFNSSNNATFALDSSNGNASFAGSITGSTITGSSLNINGKFIVDTAGKVTATDATITGAVTATSGSFTGTLNSSSGTIGGMTLSATGMAAGTLIVMDASNGDLYNKRSIINGATIGSYNFAMTGDGYLTGSWEAIGFIRANGELYAAGHQTTTNTANGYVFATGGRIARFSSSSMRYKENITDIVNVPGLDPKQLLNLPIRAFSYKDGYLPATDDRAGVMIPGFIAEEVDAVYPIAADYTDKGVESVNDRMILAGTLALVQDLYAQVQQLKGA